MQFGQTLHVVDECLNGVLDNFELKLKEKKLSVLAEGVVANEVAKLQKQFVKLITPNVMGDSVLEEMQPQKIEIDSLSNFRVELKPKSHSVDTMMSTSKICRGRGSSVIKHSTTSIKEKTQKSVVKLGQQEPSEPTNEPEERLRRFYLLRLQHERKNKQFIENQEIERQKLKQRQDAFLKNHDFFTYDYNGKILEGNGKAKQVHLATSMRSGINRKMNIVKKIERKIVEEQTVRTIFYDSTYRNRKTSVQMKQDRSLRESMIHQTPMFQKVQPTPTQTISSLKLSEYQKLCHKNKERQKRFFMTETKHSIQLPTVNTLASSTSLEPEKKKTRLSMQSVLSKKKSKEVSLDRIRVNTDLYQSMILDE